MGHRRANQAVHRLLIQSHGDQHARINGCAMVTNMPVLTDIQYAMLDRDILDNLPAAQIARRNHISVSTVRRWTRLRQERGRVAPIRAKGRPRAMSDEAVDGALEMLLKNKVGGSRVVAKQLVVDNKISRPVAHTTVLRNVKRAATKKGMALKCSRAGPRKVLTRKNRDKRVAFAQRHLHEPWDRILFTDRKRFYFRNPGQCVAQCGWFDANKGGRPGSFQPTNPNCYNVYGGITRNGTTPLHRVSGTTNMPDKFFTKKGQPARNITKEQYRKILKGTLLPGGRRLFSSRGESGWTLQQDGDPCHKVAGGVVAEWNRGSRGGHVDIMADWPPNSPDLSPIENVWGIVDTRAALAGCQDFTKYCAEVRDQFKNVSQETLANLFNSMPKRMQQVIERDGALADY